MAGMFRSASLDDLFDQVCTSYIYIHGVCLKLISEFVWSSEINFLSLKENTFSALLIFVQQNFRKCDFYLKNFWLLIIFFLGKKYFHWHV